jgi:hypothetical protein
LYTEADSPYPAEKITSTASYNTKPGAGFPDSCRFGMSNFAAANFTFYLDDMAVTDVDYLGPSNATQTAPLLYANTSEAGVNATTLTLSNSGDSANTAFNEMTNAGGIIYSNAQVAHGALSLNFQPVTGSNYISWLALATPAAASCVYAYFTGFPPATTEIVQLTTTKTGTFALLARTVLTSDGKISYLDSSTSLWTSPTAISLNTWYRFEMYAAIGGTTTTGTLNGAYYLMDSTTAVGTFATTSANLGSLNFGTARFGKINTTTWADLFYMDDFAIQQQATGFIGPYSSPPSPPATYSGIIPFKGWGVQV